MQKLTVRRIGYAMGAEVTGVDATRPPDGGTVEALRAALLDHVVLCLPGQDLEPEHMRAFCGRFGELDDNRGSVNGHPDFRDVMIVANKPVMIHGKPAAGYGRATHWHSDFSFAERPTTLTFLCAKEIPEVGGDTMYANQYMAYESLSPAMRAVLESMSAVHDIAMGPGYAASPPEQQARIVRNNPAVVQSVVRAHPETGRKALYLGHRVRNFTGMTEEESRPLIDFLNEHATRYEFLYRHRWRVGDLLIWDNRCAMHMAVPDYDYKTAMRRMLRCSLLGPRTGHVQAVEERQAALV